ncbi:MAG: hypothetical protein C4547_01820 [Phycisphaerales bacterium]|nr:MAG: hypothetical protein C4547_01820 [Phycisphaerales bacterium]
MKDPQPTPLDDRMLDLHLGRLDADERAELQAALESSPEARARFEALGRLLRPLDQLTVPTPPAGLADRIMTQLPAQPPTVETWVDDGAPAAGGSRFALRDLLAVAACIALLICVVLPGIAQLRRHSLRTVCADQFKSIYRGVAAYAQAHGGALPNAGTINGASWLYSTPPGSVHQSNSRHAWLLVRNDYVTGPSAFVCPAGDQTAVEVADARRLDDFPAAANCTYDLLNMSGAAPSMSDGGSLAYMADSNPLFPEGFFDDGVNPNTTNSPLHGGAGQNVLCLNGEVKWMTTPFRTRDDNIWLAAGIQHYNGTEAQQSRDDSFLVPATPVLLMSYKP